MITEQDLKSLKTDEEDIIRTQQRIADLREKARSLTQTMSDMPRSGSSDDKMAAFVAQMDGLQKSLARKIVELEKKRQRIDAAVDELPEQQRRVIRFRFYDHMSWQKVSWMTHYDRRYLLKIKDAAIRRLKEEKRTQKDTFKGL